MELDTHQISTLLPGRNTEIKMNSLFVKISLISILVSCNLSNKPGQTSSDILNENKEIPPSHSNRIIASSTTLVRPDLKLNIEYLLNNSACRTVEIELSQNSILDLGLIQLDGSTSVHALANAYPFIFESQLRHLSGNELGGTLLSRGGLISNKTVIIEFKVKSNKVKRAIFYTS